MMQLCNSTPLSLSCTYIHSHFLVNIYFVDKSSLSAPIHEQLYLRYSNNRRSPSVSWLTFKIISPFFTYSLVGNIRLILDNSSINFENLNFLQCFLTIKILFIMYIIKSYFDKSLLAKSFNE